MTTEASATRLSIVKIMAKGSCPICVALIDDQYVLVETLKASDGMRFCNYHAWSIANKAPRKAAITVLLEGLRDRTWKPVPFGSGDCDICAKFALAKEARLRELQQELENPKVQDWLRREGTICHLHADELEERLADSLVELVRQIEARNVHELEEQLLRFEQEVTNGIRRGTEILARVTEFLVSRRGIVA